MSAAGGLVITLGLQGRRVVVTGGGGAALRRVSALRGTGADVVLVATDVVPALQDLADRGEVTWLGRDPDEADLEGAWLVVAASEDAAVDGRVAGWADARGTWCVRDGSAATAWWGADTTGSDTTGTGREGDGADGLADGGLADGGLADGGPAPQDDRTGAAGARRTGRVVLVGGGPGDPGLLTLRGMRALREADVVVTDRLAPLAVLDELDPAVEVVDVSKVPRGRTTTQERINELLVGYALQGKVVVRLKGGDGFVLGRGMEELVACTEAGVAVEVVPGVTSATAVPALAGIPVTHRDLSQGLTVVSAHVPPGDPRSTLDWSALAAAGTTLVLLMAVQTLPAVAQALTAAGMPSDTPVACVEDGGLPTQRVLTGRLADIASVAREQGLRPPAVTVIGHVAAFALPGAAEGNRPTVAP